MAIARGRDAHARDFASGGRLSESETARLFVRGGPFCGDVSGWQQQRVLGLGNMYKTAVSPDGERIAGAGSIGLVVWNVQTGLVEAVLQGHTRRLLSLAWSPDGSKIASGSADRTVKIWDAGSFGLISTLEGHTDQVFGVSWSPDGTKIVSSGASRDPTLRIWAVDDGTLLTTIDAHTAAIRSVAWSCQRNGLGRHTPMTANTIPDRESNAPHR